MSWAGYGNAAISGAFTSSACTYSVVGRVKLRFTCMGLDIGAIFVASVNCTTAVETGKVETVR